ncbi:caspase family protein [Pectobacteriaceae bacterium CE70]|nr:caspase family protein [Pectobacteriaceae bacterium CE70]WJY09761.1 caspase family protein [Pectobacteriaceae bacterium C80]
MPGDRRVGLVAVGVNRTGVLTLEELKGAAAGAHEFADWLRQQTLFGVEPIIKVITDDEGSVTSRNIQNAVQEMINDGGLDLMILYFSGHGIVKNGDSEQVLLSEVSQYPDEAIDITATIKQAQKLRIPHIVIISDACRNAVDPFGPLGQVSGKTAILSTSFKGVRRPKVDVFYATEPSQTAKEYKGNGFFTQVLLEALIESPPDVCEQWPGFSTPVIPTWRLEDYLYELVPTRAHQHMPSFDQFPQIDTSSRQPLFLGYPMPKQADSPVSVSIPDQFNADFLKQDEDVDMFIHSEKQNRLHDNEFPTKRANLANAGEYRKIIGLKNLKPSPARRRSEAFVKLTSSLNKNRVIPDNLLDEVGINEEVQRNLKTSRASHSLQFMTGYYITGAEVTQVLDCSGRSLSIQTIDHALHSVINLEEATVRAPYSVIIMFRTGTMAVLPIMSGYIGTIGVTDGLINTLTFRISRLNPLYESLRRGYQPLIEQRQAIVAALASSGKLRLLGKSSAQNMARVSRADKHLDPTLGIYASYAYVLAGHDANAKSILRSFQRYQMNFTPSSPIPFDCGLLGGAFGATSAPSSHYAPFCPMMSLGWSLFDTDTDNSSLPSVVLDAGKHRLNAEWSTFLIKDSTSLIEAFIGGELS